MKIIITYLIKNREYDRKPEHRGSLLEFPLVVSEHLADLVGVVHFVLSVVDKVVQLRVVFLLGVALDAPPA